MRSYTFVESGLTGFGLEALKDVGHGGSWHFGLLAEPGMPEMLLTGPEREFFDNRSSRQRAAVLPADIEEFLPISAAPGGWAGSLGRYQSMVREGAARPVSARHAGARRRRGGATVASATSRRTMAHVATDVEDALIDGSGHVVAQTSPNRIRR